MKTKLICGFIFALLGVVLLSQQVKSVVAQSTENINTTVITRPISYFTLNGQVTYKVFGKLLPAANVWVRINKLETGSWYYVGTNNQGNYTAYVTNGDYLVSAIDSLGTQFKPSSLFVTVNGGSVNNISFQGRLQTKK